MSSDRVQLTISGLELAVFVGGLGLIGWQMFRSTGRARWLQVNALPPWPIALLEFGLLISLVFLGGFMGQVAVRALLAGAIGRAADHEALEIVCYSVANYLAAGAGWRLFPYLRQRLYADYGTVPPPVSVPVTPRLTWSRVLRYGGGAFLVAMPVILVLGFGWTALLHRLGLPEDAQPLLAIFTGARSRWVVAGLLIVACVLAPLYEELLFRAGLYRFCRQHLGRTWALVISGGCFGAMHQNWAGFVPLAALGMLLALAYEATGSIAVAVIAHGLFNLNTIVVLLAGLNDLQP